MHLNLPSFRVNTVDSHTNLQYLMAKAVQYYIILVRDGSLSLLGLLIKLGLIINCCTNLLIIDVIKLVYT